MGLVEIMNSEGGQQRKKLSSNFDIAFLTGQSERDRDKDRQDSDSSSNSSIDVISHNNESTKSKSRKRKSGESEERVGVVVSSPREIMIPKLTPSFNFLPHHHHHHSQSIFTPSFPPLPITSGGPKLRRSNFYGDTPIAFPSPAYHHHPFLISPPITSSSSHSIDPPPPPPSSESSSNPTLLPPSLAALTLPAQNVCAKCKIGFRMTSDLVYHMRSHHKRDPDPLKKKREDKLKCPVCHETFRERHHLTRHMTAHQDRAEEVEDKVKHS